MDSYSVRNAGGGIALLVASLCVSCGSGGSSSASPAKDGGDATDDSGPASNTGGSGAITETGVLIDYETLKPVAGLTITDNGVSTTTSATGAFTLSIPGTATLLAPTVTGPKYSMLLFPEYSPTGTAIDYGTNVIPDSSTYTLEQDILQNDTTKALVQIVVQVSGACTSAVGGTLQVLSPTGTTVSYFSLQNIPDKNTTSFLAVTSPRPVAVVSDVSVGAELTLAVTHPTCTLMSFPTAGAGAAMARGKVTTKATEPGDVNGAIVLTLH
jgi:hypothetical protein